MASELYVETLKGLTSGANANKVIIPSGQTLDASAGGFTTPAGHVIQVVSGSSSPGDSSITSNSWTDTSITASITPSSTSSKIVVGFTFQYGMFVSGSGSSYGGLRMLRDSTVIYGSGSDSGNLYTEGAGSGNQQYRIMSNMTYTDAPSTTSQVTYKIQGRLFNGSQLTLHWSAMPFSYTLMEIAG